MLFYFISDLVRLYSLIAVGQKAAHYIRSLELKKLLKLCCVSTRRGKGEPVTELSWPSCRQLLYQSVATVLAHAGFESANESVLETLTDLVHEHYLRITRRLRVAVDREARLGASPFPDVVEQVFHEVGVGSVLALQRFWQVRIKDYHTYMLQVSGTSCATAWRR